jgi:hypothetical protein
MCLLWEKFEDAKGVVNVSPMRKVWRYQRSSQCVSYEKSLKIPKGKIRSLKSQKDRKYNDQKEKEQ